MAGGQCKIMCVQQREGVSPLSRLNAFASILSCSFIEAAMMYLWENNRTGGSEEKEQGTDLCSVDVLSLGEQARLELELNLEW